MPLMAPIRMGGARGFSDIAIFEEGKEQSQENVNVLVQVKSLEREGNAIFSNYSFSFAPDFLASSDHSPVGASRFRVHGAGANL